MTSSEDELRIVLIGKTGNGKSSTGNSLLHSPTAFLSAQSAESITKDCQVQISHCTDRHGKKKKLLVVDTPGFFDTNPTITNPMVEKRITSQIFTMTSPGVHAFLIVLRIGRFTPEEKNTVDFIKTIFGTDAARYCIVIFTCEDQLELGQPLDKFISSSKPLEELVDICGKRKLAINNKSSLQSLENKRKELLQMIDGMVNSNNGTYYTNATYQQIERQRREEQQRREQEERNRKKAYEDALVARAREEERKKAAERELQIRKEGQRQAEMREQKAREEERQRAEERARREAQERARREAEERARRETEERARREAEERARRDAEERTRRDAEERARRDAEERARRATEEEARLERMRNQTRATQCFPTNNGDYGTSFLGAMSQMSLGSPTPQMNTGMGMSYAMPRPVRSERTDQYGGRFTGGFMTTRGSANGRSIQEGRGGGLYYINANGNRTYQRK